MNANPLKRQRSEESTMYSVQCKVYVNEKLVNSHDSNKMKQIYEKTNKMLFDAAQNRAEFTDTNNNKQKGDRLKGKVPLPTWKLVSLQGNGDVESLRFPDGVDEEDPVNEFLWVKRPAKCCQRDTYVQSQCGNQCSKELCEFCGYSCLECGVFICNTCVDIFGSGSWDHPVCERCSIFV